MPTPGRGISWPAVAMLGIFFTVWQNLSASRAAAGTPAFEARIEIEETVYNPPEYVTTNNGSGAFWCLGNTTLARVGDTLFVSAFEHASEAAPLNNARWALYRRTADRWGLCQRDTQERTREPSPIGVARDGRLFMSVNPTLAPLIPANPATDKREMVKKNGDVGHRFTGGPARPEFLVFDPAHPEQEPLHLLPQWNGEPKFTEHSYRSFAVDGETGEAILFQNIGYTHSEWALRRRDNQWSTGQLHWPPQGEDPKYSPYHTKHARVNYPNVALRNREVHFCGSAAYNIWNRIDPEKTETWGRDKWGNRARRLWYAWTPDVTNTPFSAWLEVDSAMDTGGWMFAGDLWLAPDGSVHLTWVVAPINRELRDTYFPDIMRPSLLKYAVIEKGRIATKSVVLVGGETAGPLVPNGPPRFHITPRHEVYIICHITATAPAPAAATGNYAVRVGDDGTFSEPVRIPLTYAASTFFTATPRAGNRLTEAVDLLMDCRVDGKPAACYARVAFVPPCSPTVTVEGARVLMPGEGRTVRLNAKITDPQNDVTAVEWRLPGGEIRQGPNLEWTAPDSADPRFAIEARVRDAQDNTARAAVTVSLPPPELAAAKTLVRVEAENFAGQGGGEVKVCHPVGTTASISYWEKDVGHWLEWEFDVPIQGRYELWMRYTTPQQPRRALLIDGQSPGPEFADIAIPATGSWSGDKDDWAYLRLGSTLPLAAGKHRLRLTNLAGGLGVDFFVLRPVP